MNKLFAIILVIGFLVVDFLFFHDIFKPGENTSPAQYLTGFLSLAVFILCARILSGQRTVRK